MMEIIITNYKVNIMEIIITNYKHKHHEDNYYYKYKHG